MKIGNNQTHVALLACLKDVSQIVIKLIESGSSINASDGASLSLIHYAVRQDNLELVRYLLENGANAGALDKFGKTPYDYAVERGNVKLINQIVDFRVNSGAPTRNRLKWFTMLLEQQLYDVFCNSLKDLPNGEIEPRETTPLNLLVSVHPLGKSKKGHIEKKLMAIQKLIDLGADVKLVDSFSNSPLKKAVETGNESVLNILIKNGADVNLQIENKNNLLDSALLLPSPFMLNTLINVGIKHVSNSNQIFRILDAAFKNYDDYNLGFLNECGFTERSLDEDGNQLLHLAVKSGKTNYVRILLNAGVSPDNKNDKGWTSLHSSSFYDRLSIVKILVAAGAKINALTNSGETPLLLAENRENWQITSYLCQSGADPSIKDKDGNSYESITKAKHEKYELEKRQKELKKYGSKSFGILDSEVIERNLINQLENILKPDYHKDDHLNCKELSAIEIIKQLKSDGVEQWRDYQRAKEDGPQYLSHVWYDDYERPYLQIERSYKKRNTDEKENFLYWEKPVVETIFDWIKILKTPNGFLYIEEREIRTDL